jgi:hypothetical protein
MAKILKSDNLESTTISSTKDASLLFSTRPSDVLTTRLTILSGGNVGIGTESPGSKFTVDSGDIRISDNYGIGAGSGAQGIYNGTTQFVRFDTASTERLRITGTGAISFGASGTAYGSSGQVLTSQGNTTPIWRTYSTLTLNTSGLGLSGSTTYTPAGAATFTVTSNATASNTGGTIVARDGGGSFTAGTITATLSGNVTGNVSGNATTSSSCTGNAATSSSCTGNSATATTAAGLSSSGHTIDISTSTYGNFRVTGSKGGYVGTEYSLGGNLNTLMFDGSGNGGLYNYSGWLFYYNKGNTCLGIGTSSTSSSYIMYVASKTVGAAVNSIYAEGNIVAYSDERIKKNWQNLTPNFIEKLSKVKSGVYERIDAQGAKQVGVSAQSLREVMPEAVIENTDNDRKLGVSYGNAALAACVELAKEIVDLKEQIKNLKK